MITEAAAVYDGGSFVEEIGLSHLEQLVLATVKI